MSAHGFRCNSSYGYSAAYGTPPHYHFGCVANSTLRLVAAGSTSAASADELRLIYNASHGLTSATLLVVAENAVDECRYEISISRGKSDNAVLQSLLLELSGSGVTLTRPMNNNSLNNNSLLVDGVYTVHEELENWVTFVSAVPSFPVSATVEVSCPSCASLPVGDSLLTITVLAEDLAHMLVYHITLHRQPSDVCTLEGLRLLHAPGESGASSEVKSWNAQQLEALEVFWELRNEVIWIQLQVYTSHAGTTLQLQDGASSAWVDVPLSGLSTQLAMPVGDKRLQLRGTSEQGDTCIYELNLDRPHSSDASIGSLVATIIIGQDMLGRVTPVVAGVTPCDASSCYGIALSNSEDTFLLSAITNHSFLCNTVAHACIAPTTLAYSAPAAEVSVSARTNSNSGKVLQPTHPTRQGTTLFPFLRVEDPTSSLLYRDLSSWS